MDDQGLVKPTSLTVIGVIIALLGVFAGVGAGSMYFLKDDPNMQAALQAAPLSLEALVALSGLGAVINLIAGIGIASGANWARWLYVGYGVIGIGVGLYANPSPWQVAPSIVILAIFSFFLFRPREDAYFKRTV